MLNVTSSFNSLTKIYALFFRQPFLKSTFKNGCRCWFWHHPLQFLSRGILRSLFVQFFRWTLKINWKWYKLWCLVKNNQVINSNMNTSYSLILTHISYLYLTDNVKEKIAKGQKRPERAITQFRKDKVTTV